MKKNVTIAAVAVLVIILMIALIAFTGKDAEEATAPELAATTEAVPTETEEETVPGVEDSIFDEEPDETKETAATEETKNSGQGSSTDTTLATEPEDPKPAEPKPTDPSEPEATTEATEPTETMPAPTNLSEYEKFQSLSPSEQQEYVESFPSIDEFFNWYNAAKEEYEKANPPIEVGSGTIDVSQIIGGKN